MSLHEKFLEYNKNLLDQNVPVEDKKKILEELKDHVRGSAENSSLAIRSGLFFGLVALAKNVKTDEETLDTILTILGNLTAGNTEDYTLLVNEGCQNLIMEFADPELPDRICEGVIFFDLIIVLSFEKR